MTEPVSSTVGPIAALGIIGTASMAYGVDPDSVIAAFGGALLFAFMAKDVSPSQRLLGLVAAGIFGYYAGTEIVKRKLLGFESPHLPTYFCAFFGVALFRLLLTLFNDEGKTWIRKRFGLSEEKKGD